MNPYGISSISREAQIVIARDRERIARVRREYTDYPIASCPWRGCWNLLEFDERVCPEHLEQVAAARYRMRAVRAERKAS